MHDGAAREPLEARAERPLQARDEVCVRGAAVQEERELLRGRERRGEAELRGERVQLQRARAVVQPVVVEPELAERDKPAGARGPRLGDEGSERGQYGVCPRGVGGGLLTVRGGCVRVGSARRRVLGFLVVGVGVVRVRGVENGGGAGVDSGGCVDGSGWEGTG